MRYRLLDFIVCPRCEENFSCEVNGHTIEAQPTGQQVRACRYWCSFKGVDVSAGISQKACERCCDVEVTEGWLHCRRGHSYPITGGVPVLFHQPLDNELARTAHAFGFEWTEFFDYDVNNFEVLTRFLTRGFFQGKLGLDVGCGAGRHAMQAAQRGAEIIGIDVSRAAHVAYQKTRHLPNVHIVQCDIYRSPFRRGIFDFLYSLGVFHHLSDPERGFNGMIKFLKPQGGTCFFLVYQKSVRKWLLEPIRWVTTRLTTRMVTWLSTGAAAIDYGIVCQSYRLLKMVPLVGPLADALTPDRIKEYSGYSFRVSVTDWFDRLSAPIGYAYTPDEITEWLTRARLRETTVVAIDSSWIYGSGTRADHMPED